MRDLFAALEEHPDKKGNDEVKERPDDPNDFVDWKPYKLKRDETI